MEMKELMKARAEQTLTHLLEKIDRVCDNARDDGGLTAEDVRTQEKAWCTVRLVEEMMKE